MTKSKGWVCKVAGMSYREYKGEKEHLRLTLVPDDDNEYDKQNNTPPDSRAVKVLLNGQHIGYLPMGKQPTDVCMPYIYRTLVKQGKEPKAAVRRAWYSFQNGKETYWNTYGVGKLSGMEIVVYTDDGAVETDEGRFYIKDGKLYRSITACLDYMPQENTALIKWMINKFDTYEEYEQFMNETADKGAQFHLDMEAVLEHVFEDKPLPDDVAQRVGKHRIEFVQKMKAAGAVLLKKEETVWDDYCSVAGTYDALIDGPRGPHIIDWKTSREVRDKHLYQAAFYAYNAHAQAATIVCMPESGKIVTRTIDRHEIYALYGHVVHLANLLTELSI